MYDSMNTDSPHLSGVQPTWGDLPYGCEILNHYFRTKKSDRDELPQKLAKRNEKNKVPDMIRFLGPGKLGLINSDQSLSPFGVWIAYNFERDQHKPVNRSLTLGNKEGLSQLEQTVFGVNLFERDWTPMVATIHLLVTESVSATETEARANSFRERVNHLEGYQKVSSIYSWKKKVQPHIKWMKYLGLASEQGQRVVLTWFGQRMAESLRTSYPRSW